MITPHPRKRANPAGQSQIGDVDRSPWCSKSWLTSASPQICPGLLDRLRMGCPGAIATFAMTWLYVVAVKHYTQHAHRSPAGSLAWKMDSSVVTDAGRFIAG